MGVSIHQRRDQSAVSEVSLISWHVRYFLDDPVLNGHTHEGPRGFGGVKEPAKSMNPAVIHGGSIGFSMQKIGVHG